MSPADVPEPEGLLVAGDDNNGTTTHNAETLRKVDEIVLQVTCLISNRSPHGAQKFRRTHSCRK